MAKAQLPEWWIKVHSGINAALAALTKVFDEPGAILGSVESSDHCIGYFVRDRDRSIGFLPQGKTGGRVSVGSKIKGKFQLDSIPTGHSAPDFRNFAREVLHERVKSLPLAWLTEVIDLRLKKSPVLLAEIGALRARLDGKLANLERSGKTVPNFEDRDYTLFWGWIAMPFKAREEHIYKMMYHSLVGAGLEGLRHQNWVFTHKKIQEDVS